MLSLSHFSLSEEISYFMQYFQDNGHPKLLVRVCNRFLNSIFIMAPMSSHLVPFHGGAGILHLKTSLSSPRTSIQPSLKSKGEDCGAFAIHFVNIDKNKQHKHRYPPEHSRGDFWLLKCCQRSFQSPMPPASARKLTLEAICCFQACMKRMAIRIDISHDGF